MDRTEKLEEIRAPLIEMAKKGTLFPLEAVEKIIEMFSEMIS